MTEAILIADISAIRSQFCEATFAESAFSGEGASIVGGRWNSKGK